MQRHILASSLEVSSHRNPAAMISARTTTARLPVQCFFGKAFNHEHVVELDKLFRGKGNAPVAWIAGGPNTEFPANPGSDYAEKAAQNVVKAFLEWKESGANSEDIVYY